MGKWRFFGLSNSGVKSSQMASICLNAAKSATYDGALDPPQAPHEAPTFVDDLKFSTSQFHFQSRLLEDLGLLEPCVRLGMICCQSICQQPFALM
jgi:hypothetical protein